MIDDLDFTILGSSDGCIYNGRCELCFTALSQIGICYTKM
jgi:hypothetical protein